MIAIKMFYSIAGTDANRQAAGMLMRSIPTLLIDTGADERGSPTYGITSQAI